MTTKPTDSLPLTDAEASQATGHKITAGKA